MKEDSLAIIGSGMVGGGRNHMHDESILPTKQINDNGLAIKWDEKKINEAVYDHDKAKIGSGTIKNIV